MTRVASIAVGFAGLIHIFLAPQHYSHAPAHGIFFALAGVAQIIWAIAFFRQPDSRMYYIGLALAGGLVVLWAITRVLPALFHDQAEVVDLGGIACKISELLGLGALLSLAAQGGILGLGKQTFARVLAVALLVAGTGGIVSYSVGRAAEPLFPSLFGVEHSDADHHVGEEHDHSE